MPESRTGTERRLRRGTEICEVTPGTLTIQSQGRMEVGCRNL